METLSPALDRIGAALRALRETHRQTAGDKTALGLKCLNAVIVELAAEGISAEDLQPLVDLETDARARVGVMVGQGKDLRRERRRGTAPSPVLLARASAVIDLLVKGGHDEGEAAQTVMRRLVAAGVPAPTQGGDARGWRRLLEWRNTLLHGYGPEEAKLEYRAFSHELETIPPAERIKRVLDERLWDRRRNPR